MLKTIRSFCRKERHAINHIFWSCSNIKLFWEQLRTAVNERCVNVPSIKFYENIVRSVWTWCQFSVRWRSWFKYSVGNGFIFVFTNVKFERSDHNFIYLNSILGLHLNYKNQHQSRVSMSYHKFITNWHSYKTLVEVWFAIFSLKLSQFVWHIFTDTCTCCSHTQSLQLTGLALVT